MYFRQFQLACLSHFSYLIGDESTGRAAVVDPQRDVSEYLADADAHRLSIDWVIETHLHADFLSGHLELAAATGARVAYGAAARTDFPVEHLQHGQRIELGDVVLEVRHTPGHTPESICIVVWEHRDDAVPFGVLTGDTLFIGDVGRPDLLVSTGVTAQELGTQLHRSLHEQLLPLPDSTRVFPAHGAGSACGKHITNATDSTIGEQRRTNDALADMSEQAFVDMVTRGLSTPPPYFSHAATTNRRRHPLLDESAELRELDATGLRRARERGAVFIDTRNADEFAAGHLRSSVNVGLDGRFAEYAGDLIAPDAPVVVIADPGRSREGRVRLARIGFDNVEGALEGVAEFLRDHPEEAEVADRVRALELAELQRSEPRLQIVDVRSIAEQSDGVVPGSISMPLPELLDRTGELEATAPTVVVCGSGYRSSAAASALRARGFTDVADLVGGYPAWSALPADATALSS